MAFEQEKVSIVEALTHPSRVNCTSKTYFLEIQVLQIKVMLDSLYLAIIQQTNEVLRGTQDFF